MFFGLCPPNAVLSDINADLIATYQQVRSYPDALIERLKQYSVDESSYARVRAHIPTDPLEFAARFLYLNRTSFGGMYRLNRDGQFNVPFGGGQRTPEPLWREGLLDAAAEVLKGATLRADDFEAPLSETGTGDLVYCDPTYTVAHNNNGFVRYNERNFSWADQQRLARAGAGAAARGATVLISNAVHPEIVHLYPGARVHVVTRWSGLCPDPALRQQTHELLFVLAPERKKRRYYGPPVPEIRRLRSGTHPRRKCRDSSQWTGDRVRELRQSLRLTQAALAEQLRVGRGTVSGWETGAYIPRQQHVQALDRLATERIG